MLADSSFRRFQKDNEELYVVKAQEKNIEALFALASCPADFAEILSSSSAVSRGSVYVSNQKLNDEKVLLRPLKRGGLPRYLSEKYYFREANPRPLAELQTLTFLKENSVSVVTPIAAFVAWGPAKMFYQGALLTGFEENASTIDQILLRLPSKITEEESSRVCGLAKDAGKQTARCLQLGIFHRDLHPSNVLIVKDKAVLIDFDRAKEIQTERLSYYFDAQVERWQRFLEKYQRPLRKELVVAFVSGMRQIIKQ